MVGKRWLWPFFKPKQTAGETQLGNTLISKQLPITHKKSKRMNLSHLAWIQDWKWNISSISHWKIQPSTIWKPLWFRLIIFRIPTYRKELKDLFHHLAYCQFLAHCPSAVSKFQSRQERCEITARLKLQTLPSVKEIHNSHLTKHISSAEVILHPCNQAPYFWTAGLNLVET